MNNASLSTEDSGLHLVTPRRTRKKPSALAKAERSHTAELTALRQELAQSLETVQIRMDETLRVSIEALSKKAQEAAAPVAVEVPVKRNGTAAVLGGAALGVFVPLAAHTLVHAPERSSQPHILWLVAACLAYSAPTVCAWAGSFTTAGASHWASKTLGWIKAVGFVACLEGILVAAPPSCDWLSWIALGLLMGINAVILGMKFKTQ